MSRPLLVTLGALFGSVAWTFLEYWMHRHKHRRRVSGPDPKGHHRHHAEPTYFVPTSVKVGTAVGTAIPTAIVSVAVLGFWAGSGFVVGLTAAYCLYERIHWTSHYRAPRTRFGQRVRRNHFTHHFMCPNRNFGFTTAWWDRVFGTYVEVDCVRVPRRHALPWLVADGNIRPEFVQQYQLVGRAAGAAELTTAGDAVARGRSATGRSE